ncbi:MAG TPA: peptidase dimerization domain-containing protein, partial [Synergistales bacterium]|nr:peptidase dimerization domain-containing protein [Synergistales bacterium]
GMPSRATDLLLPASRIIQDVQQIQTRDFDNLKPTIITFCSIHGGTSPIVFPRELTLKGSIRYLHEDTEEVEKRFEEIIAAICSMAGCTYDLKIIVSNRLLSNDREMTDMATGVLEDIFGQGKICRDMRMMVGEDFAEFAMRIPSVFYFIGTGNRHKGTDHPHHSPLFNIDEDSLPLGVECHIRNAMKFFERS